MPCIHELPGIERLYDSLKNDERVAFLNVAVDDEQRVRDFLTKNPLRVPIYLGERSSSKGLSVMGVPTTFILDRKGAAVFRERGAANWDSDGARAYIRTLASGPG